MLKMSGTIGWCKTGLPEFKKCMEENNTLSTTAIADVCVFQHFAMLTSLTEEMPL
jgi:hypothetical protein